MKRWRTGCLRSWSRATSIRLPLSACLRRKRISARQLLCSIRSWSVWKAPQNRKKALHDIVCAVKRNSYERDSAQLGTDVAALNRVIAGKKQLEELAKTHISLE